MDPTRFLETSCPREHPSTGTPVGQSIADRARVVLQSILRGDGECSQDESFFEGSVTLQPQSGPTLEQADEPLRFEQVYRLVQQRRGHDQQEVALPKYI